ncbi:hypothetical protein HUF15_20410 [Streptomyces samsunensis]|uniref:Small hydrophilic protein n=3 Tax=Streptomyces TaxID=1883 RepID=A0ABX6W2M3_STRMQ|nr:MULTISPECIES: hypothetical protein [Streptomyces]MYU20052.1 hypothetical protein [Streptomyces sp. SID8361]AQA11339.1 hypothetical protein BV401_13450 [Streptomyces autolyticus]ATL82230.1 hypothetical protein SMALA_1996 [Streptomyces malaysiensis]AUA14464.1 hypothetical protein CFP59_06642 [Streptomyces sp. M56]MCC4322246.1 hypothetical protein [Streptomyces malaysiensis]
MGKNKNRDRKQQQDERRQERGMDGRPADQQSSMDSQSQPMRSEDSPSTSRKRQKSFGHN